MYEEDRNVLIKKIAELTEENNRMLHREQRSRRIGYFFTILHWLVIVALAGGIYYYLQPWVDGWEAFYQERQAELDRITEVINNLLNLSKTE